MGGEAMTSSEVSGEVRAEGRPKKEPTPEEREKMAQIRAERDAKQAEREEKAHKLEEEARQSAIAMTLHLVEIELLDEDGDYPGKHGTQSEYVNHKCRGPLCRYAASRGRRGGDKINLNTVRGRIDEACDEVIRALIDDHHRQYEARTKELKLEREHEREERARADNARRVSLVAKFEQQRKVGQQRIREWEEKDRRDTERAEAQPMREKNAKRQGGGADAGAAERQRKREAILARQRHTRKHKE